MKISVSSYSFMQYIRQGKMTVLDTIAKAKEIGLEAIEFIDMPGATLEEQKDCARQLRAEADRLGMTINSYTIGANLYKNSEEADRAEIERLKGQVDVAEILGVSVMRHDCCYNIYKEGNGRSFDLMLPTIAKNARRVSTRQKRASRPAVRTTATLRRTATEWKDSSTPSTTRTSDFLWIWAISVAWTRTT